MELPSHTVVDVLTFLLPGFISAALLYNLTPAPRPIPFERVVQALIFTMIVQVCVIGVRIGLTEIGSRLVIIGRWTDEVRLTWSVVLAVLLGFVMAWMANTDRVHSLLRKAGITQQTSYSSEWYGAFCQNKGYVVLHIKGQRRLYGWPQEWPSTPRTGHFVMAQAEWLTQDGRVALTGVNQILVRAEDVEMVELMAPALAIESEVQSG